MCSALSGGAPYIKTRESVVKQLLEVYKRNAVKEQTNVDDQRVNYVVAQAQRVEDKAKRDTKVSTRRDLNAASFLITLKNGPPWSTVVTRTTR